MAKKRLIRFSKGMILIGMLLTVISLNIYIRNCKTKPSESQTANNKSPGITTTDISRPPVGEMVLIKGGTFSMGQPNQDIDGTGSTRDEQPVHTVTVNDFYLGKTEVRQKEFQEVMEVNYSYNQGDNFPVKKITWYDAVLYCNARSRRDGLDTVYSYTSITGEPGNGSSRLSGLEIDFSRNGFRLPTEAEWEYAARGGLNSKGYKYSGSNNINSVGWYTGNSRDKTHPVGEKQANELGLYDMSGNVWEWCHDWYDEDYYKKSPRNNPQGPSSGVRRVLRGGCYVNYGVGCRPTYRFKCIPNGRDIDIGFRLARGQGSGT